MQLRGSVAQQQGSPANRPAYHVCCFEESMSTGFRGESKRVDARGWSPIRIRTRWRLVMGVDIYQRLRAVPSPLNDRSVTIGWYVFPRRDVSHPARPIASSVAWGAGGRLKRGDEPVTAYRVIRDGRLPWRGAGSSCRKVEPTCDSTAHHILVSVRTTKKRQRHIQSSYM